MLQNLTSAVILLKKINWDVISQTIGDQKFTWICHRPSEPCWNGWWERWIGIIEGILRMVLGRRSLNTEEIKTVICASKSVIKRG